jgi:hypothetical protein
VEDIAVSLKGRYLACGLSDGSVNFWEVANKMEGPAFGSGSPITHLCWLEPEERLMVANGASVRIGTLFHWRGPTQFQHAGSYLWRCLFPETQSVGHRD